jgi:hypothetical protein
VDIEDPGTVTTYAVNLLTSILTLSEVLWGSLVHLS